MCWYLWRGRAETLPKNSGTKDEKIIIYVTFGFSDCFQGYIERGLFSFTYGAKDNRVDFLHADNFVQAHIKAAEALIPSQSLAVSVVCVIVVRCIACVGWETVFYF